MGEQSKIGWTGSTWNPWVGCRKASPGCANCYMERWAARAGRDPRKIEATRDRTFDLPYRLQRKVERGELEEGHTVFVCSLSDFFIEEADSWRARAWSMIRACPGLRFQLLTKRADRIAECLPESWGNGWPNVWLGVSVESGEWLGRAEALAEIPAAVRFVSAEPLIGPILAPELRPVLRAGIDWVIVGGESGAESKVRIFDEVAASLIVSVCREEAVHVFVKQAGAVTRWLSGDLGSIGHADLAWQLSPELSGIHEMPRPRVLFSHVELLAARETAIGVCASADDSRLLAALEERKGAESIPFEEIEAVPPDRVTEILSYFGVRW